MVGVARICSQDRGLHRAVAFGPVDRTAAPPWLPCGRAVSLAVETQVHSPVNLNTRGAVPAGRRCSVSVRSKALT